MENEVKSLNKKHIIRSIVMAIYCIMIICVMCYVTFRMYVPSQNSLVALSSVCMDAVCTTILMIIISSFAFGNYRSNRTTRLFLGMLTATIWALFLDFLNWAFDGSLEWGTLKYWFTVGSLCMGSILASIFSLYLGSYVEEMHDIREIRPRATICSVLNVISFILTFVLALTGNAFVFVDGHYVTGDLYDLITVIPILTMFYQTGYIIINIKRIGLHDVVAVTGYIGFMIIGVLIEAGYNIGTSYVAIAIADIFIFVMLQNEIIATEKRLVEEWKVKSNTDELTGFNNRHAYENDMGILENNPVDENFVYVSIDVNSLKKTNDTLGHAAGDEMLMGAAECLKKSFSLYGRLYRIGGDEFIALIFADEKQLEFIKKDIRDNANRWSGKMVSGLSLSCGYVTKKEASKMSVRQMASLADQRMYEAKRAYYDSQSLI